MNRTPLQHDTGTHDVSMGALRHMQRRLTRQYPDLATWTRFSIEALVALVAARVRAQIHLHPFHWEKYAYSGLTLGWAGREGNAFLVLYEEEATDEHRLVIVLHELMHILLGHCTANLAPAELRGILIEIGLLPASAQPVLYARPGQAAIRRLATYTEHAELEAELGALWLLTRARHMGSLPPTGHVFSAEQTSISTLLGHLASA